MLLELPGIPEEELTRLAGSNSSEGLWVELCELFAVDAERAERDMGDPRRLLLLHERTPS